MNAKYMLDDKIIELRKYVNENTELQIEIEAGTYPLVIKFYDTQINMFEDDEPSETVPFLCFVFWSEMRIVTTEVFKINESVFSRLKNISKEINRLYLHAFRQGIDDVIKPIWDTCDGSQVALYRKTYFDKRYFDKFREE